MYVVMTKAELYQHAGCWKAGTKYTGIEDNFIWVDRDSETESTDISQSELDAVEVYVPERPAREMGILSPRGEDWISRAAEGGERGPIPKATLLPRRKGELAPIYPGMLDGKTIIINPPPADGKCMICGRHVRELEVFGGPGDPLLGDFSGAKLVKKFRAELPGYVRSGSECRDCVARPGPLWAIREEDRLGRPLTEQEYIDREHEVGLSLLEIDEETNQSESKHRASL